VLDQQVVDWNRGDLNAFATGYKNSPDILFIGSRMNRGYAQMLEGYRKAYPTREKMGTLSFAELEAQPLDENFATVTGRFHLERTAAVGGNADGFFLLVMEKTPDGWKIVRDDTTSQTKKADQ
jgi:ketosteroid isomerase-like protein